MIKTIKKTNDAGDYRWNRYFLFLSLTSFILKGSRLTARQGGTTLQGRSPSSNSSNIPK